MEQTSETIYQSLTSLVVQKSALALKHLQVKGFA